MNQCDLDLLYREACINNALLDLRLQYAHRDFAQPPRSLPAQIRREFRQKQGEDNVTRHFNQLNLVDTKDSN